MSISRFGFLRLGFFQLLHGAFMGVLLLGVQVSNSSAVLAAAEDQPSASWVLIEDADFAALPKDEGDDLLPRGRPVSDPGAPRIQLLEPDPAAEVASPMSIKLDFVPEDDAVIDLDSVTVKIKKGFLWLDVTRRLFEHAEVSATGVRAIDAQVPPGRYEFLVRVADTRGRLGYETFTLTCIES